MLACTSTNVASNPERSKCLLAWGWEEVWGSLFTLSVFLQVCRKMQGLYHLSLPGRWSLLPLKHNSRDHVKSTLLQVVLCELITVLIFISSTPSLPPPPDAVHCLQMHCAGWWDSNHELTFGALWWLGRAVNFKRAQEGLVQTLNSLNYKCLRDGVNSKRMDALNDFAAPKSLCASVKH